VGRATKSAENKLDLEISPLQLRVRVGMPTHDSSRPPQSFLRRRRNGTDPHAYVTVSGVPNATLDLAERKLKLALAMKQIATWLVLDPTQSDSSTESTFKEQAASHNQNCTEPTRVVLGNQNLASSVAMKLRPGSLTPDPKTR